MNSAIIENWNKLVKPEDKVYHLGDVVMSKKKGDLILPRLNGKKVLIKGNHDLEKASWYLDYFKDIRACHNFHIHGDKYNFLLTHMPVHPDSKARFIRNIHGHIHGNAITKKIYFNTEHDPITTLDHWYRNVCVDYKPNNYSPVPYDLIVEETVKLVDSGILRDPSIKE